MSFTVYDGVKLRGIYTIAEALDFILELKPKIIHNIYAEKARILKNVACLLYDQLDVCNLDGFGEDDKRVPLLSALQRVGASDRDSTSEYYIGIGYASGVVVAIPYMQDKSSLRTFNDHAKVIPFAYWDNSDPDNNVSNDEWELRKRVWSEVLHGAGIPSECLLMTRLVDAQHMVPTDEYMEDVLTIEEREQSLAQNLALDRAVEEIRDTVPQSEMVSAMMKKSSELLESCKKEIHGKLNPDLTMEMLGKELPKEIT